MECLTAKVMMGTEVIAENLEVWLARSSNGDVEWNGSFELPQGTHIDAGGSYRLVLEDGRSGTFTVTNVGADDAQPHQVGFRGATVLG